MNLRLNHHHHTLRQARTPHTSANRRKFSLNVWRKRQITLFHALSRLFISHPTLHHQQTTPTRKTTTTKLLMMCFCLASWSFVYEFDMSLTILTFRICLLRKSVHSFHWREGIHHCFCRTMTTDQVWSSVSESVTSQHLFASFLVSCSTVQVLIVCCCW